MKEKILAHFKAKYPAVNLSKKRLDALADKLEPKITDESQIDAQLDALNDVFPFDDIAKSDDQIRDLNGKLRKAANPKKEPEDDKMEPEIPADAPEWMKLFMKQQADKNQALSEKLAQFEAKEKAGTIKEKVAAAFKKEGREVIPESYWSDRALPQKEEDIEGFITETTGKFSALQKELGVSHQPGSYQNGSFNNVPRVGAQSVQTGVVNPAVKKYVDAQAAKHAQQQATQVKTAV